MRALVFGGGGQVGRAVAAEFVRGGWQVDAVVRGGRPLSADLAALDVQRLDPGASRAALMRKGYDAVCDTLAYTAADAADLLSAKGSCGHLTVISTASVYADAAGRGLESADGFPDYPAKISEEQSRVAPGAGYSASKVAMELALEAGMQAAILRPGAIHGIGARHPREWWFVKRALDGRRVVPVLDAGASVFHTSSTQGIASLAVHCATNDLGGAFNAADPDAPSVAQIAAAIGAHLGQPFELVAAAKGDATGHTPWSAPRPLRLSMARARATGWDGGPRYAASLPDYLDWLLDQREDWQQAFPAFAVYGNDPFDYAAEDATLARLARAVQTA